MGAKTRLATAALLAALVALALGACGGGGGDDSTAPTDKTTAEAETSSGQDGTSPSDSTQPSGDGGSKSGGSSKSADGSSKEGQAPDSEGSGSGGSSGGSDGSGPGSKGSDGAQKGGASRGGAQKGGKAPTSKPSNGLKGIRSFGSEAAPGESDEAKGALEAYLQNFSKKDWGAVCGALAKPALRQMDELAAAIPQLNGKDCVGILSTSGVTPKGLTVSIDSLSSFRIEGNVGYAFYDNDKLVMLMQKEDGEWKVNGLQPEPVP